MPRAARDCHLQGSQHERGEVGPALIEEDWGEAVNSWQPQLRQQDSVQGVQRAPVRAALFSQGCAAAHACWLARPETAGRAQDVAVSVVGKYRYTLSAPREERQLPLLVDIILVGRTKIITLHRCVPRFCPLTLNPSQLVLACRPGRRLAAVQRPARRCVHTDH